MIISVGESRKSTHWVPEEVTWDQLCDRLMTPTVTDETVSEYAAMSKDQRGEIKDVGGYVGGRINGGNRKAGAITDRQLVCLDADFGDMSLWDTWDLMVGKACLMHTSHSHTPESPRLRFVIPLSRPVTAAEYEPIARKIAQWLDINAFDDTTYEASRLMYWGSCPRDGDYICKVYPSDSYVDPDTVLAEYADWHDMRSWPTSDRQHTAVTRMGKVQGDPLTKPDPIGAFNRAYTITEAIGKYLPDVYSRCEDGRWTYNAGSSTGGAVTYDDDRFIYSYHDTDPISRRLCNAFDLVRIHLYGDLDKGKDDVPISELPSMEKMKALCREDEKVQKEYNTEAPADVFSEMPDPKIKASQNTEQNIAASFIESYGHLVLHNNALGLLFWDGTRWVVDDEADVYVLIMKFLDSAYDRAKFLYDTAEKGEKGRLKEELAKIKSLMRASGHKSLATDIGNLRNIKSVKDFDADPWALNTPGGIVDLKTGILSRPNPDALCTKSTTVYPGSEGREKWEEFIAYITDGDVDLARYLQTLIGMSAIGAVYEEGLVISFGEGRNGKSTFYGIVCKVLGDYALSVNPDSILSKGLSTSNEYYLADMRGARLVLMGETNDGDTISSALLKRVTSQDVISARIIRQSPFTFSPSHTSIMHTNYLPRLQSLDLGTRRRLAVLPFKNTLAPNEVITDYKDRLYNECGPAILQWIIDGAVKFYSAGCKLEKPRAVLDATREYIDNEDWLKAFLDDRCILGAEYSVQADLLYRAYKSWAEDNGYRNPKTLTTFGRNLKAAGFRKIKSGVISYSGLDLAANHSDGL